MDFTAQIDAYCERTDPAYWSEPVNALTNAAFLIAALVIWQRLQGQKLPLARVLVGVLALIGVGSYLFHTHARAWAALADVLPIGVFILTYIYAANRHFWRLPLWSAILGTVAFVPYAMALTPAFAALPFFQISAFYWPVPLLIGAYAVLLRHRHPQTARGLALGAGLLTLSLIFRSADTALCPSWPLGTHFLWHLLNALMLGWMIEVLRRHALAETGAGR